MRREHVHFCKNKEQGCKSSYRCRQDAVYDPDGSMERYCPANPTDSELCEDCFQAEREKEDADNAASDLL